MSILQAVAAALLILLGSFLFAVLVGKFIAHGGGEG